MYVIAIANRKGGVGKSTVTANLAAAYGLEGKRVLVIDMDSQGSSTKTLLDKAPTDATMAHVMIGRSTLAQAIRATTATNVWIAPAIKQLTDALLAIVAKPGRETIVRRQLREISDFDVVLIDTSPERQLGTVNALVASTHVVMPFSFDPVAIEGMEETVEAVAEIVEAELAQTTVLGCVQVAHDKRLGVSTSARERVSENWGTRLFESMLRFNTNFVMCTAEHRSIFSIEQSVRPPRRGSDDIRALAAEVWSRLDTLSLNRVAA